MKKSITFFAIILITICKAQVWELQGNSNTQPPNEFVGTKDDKALVFKTANKERVIVSSDGKIGIGTTPHPVVNLHVKGLTEFTSDTTIKDSNHFVNTAQNNNANTDLIWAWYEKYQANDVGLMTLSAVEQATGWPSNTVFSARANGKVLMGVAWNNYSLSGCNDCDSYRLFVKDGIKTEKIKVEFANVNGWADYVFDDNYNLMSLEDIKKYIKANKHLPEIPTAEDVVENGVELKEMNVLLLKKVEELTLHLIQLNEKLEQQNKEILKLKNYE